MVHIVALLSSEDVDQSGSVSQAVGEWFLHWSDIKHCEVYTDSEGPDFYRLPLKTNGNVLIRRFAPVGGSERYCSTRFVVLASYRCGCVAIRWVIAVKE